MEVASKRRNVDNAERRDDRTRNAEIEITDKVETAKPSLFNYTAIGRLTYKPLGLT